ncbi:MAG: tyrosine-type recombinase/integrase [Fibromonadales bacterium]|nr:tyrosine-type recombinase/integrase [Fibromonadales bacterium]
MRLDDISKMLKGSNVRRKMRLYARRTTGDNVVIWVYHDYKRESFGFPPLIADNAAPKAEELALLKRAIEYRNELEEQGRGMASGKSKASAMLTEWAGHYATESGAKNARLAAGKFLEHCGDMRAKDISRACIIRMMDCMKKQGYHANYVRGIASRFRAFCNWAEQRGYMGRVDTRKLLPPEQFGEVKALDESELRRLAAAPCINQDVKDLFLLGVYTAQRMGEIRNYTFALLRNGKIRARQGKTGKFIVIPLSEAALSIVEDLRLRRMAEGRGTGDNDKIFNLPSDQHSRRVFALWLEAAGLKGRVMLHNSRSTAISLLINRGVPESVTQELANHSDPRITARYYRQIDDSKKKEALALIPAF